MLAASSLVNQNIALLCVGRLRTYYWQSEPETRLKPIVEERVMCAALNILTTDVADVHTAKESAMCMGGPAVSYWVKHWQ